MFSFANVIATVIPELDDTATTSRPSKKLKLKENVDVVEAIMRHPQEVVISFNLVIILL